MVCLIPPPAVLLLLCATRLVREEEKKSRMKQKQNRFRKEKIVRLHRVERTTSIFSSHSVCVFSRDETFDTEAHVSYPSLLHFLIVGIPTAAFR